MSTDKSAELKKLGERLKLLRQSRNCSQEEFADLTHLDRTYVSGLERGKRNPSYLILLKIVKSLNIKPEELFTEKINVPK